MTSGKYCIVCGRPIKTGYKYCFEHRNTRDPENSQKRTYLKAESSYYRLKVIKPLLILFLLFLLITTIFPHDGVILLGLFSLLLFAAFHKDILIIFYPRKTQEYEEYVKKYIDSYIQKRDYHKKFFSK